MKTPFGTAGWPPQGPSDRFALVWIDSERASVARWADGPHVTTVLSDVPPHRRSTGHVHVDPLRGHAGGRAPDTPDAQRLAHLERFLALVADAVEGAEPVEILGPGTVREHLARLLAERDRRHGRTRPVATAPAMAVTERQLLALLRERVGEPPRRRVVGATR